MLLRVLIRNDFRVDPQCLGRLVHLCVLGVFNSVFGWCEEFFNREDIESTTVEGAPIFVIGHWRSGTTHLHNLMSLDPKLAAPNAYQACFPGHFIFSQVGGAVFDLLAPRKRPMDNVAFSSDTPHEDEFALAASSGVSPYMRVLFPVTGDNAHAALDPLRLDHVALDAWKGSLASFLKKLALSEDGKRALLKSPPHTGRIATLLEMFPDAQFVHIVRNPYDVFLSTRKLWRDSFGLSHLQVPSRERVDELILAWYTELFELFERDRNSVPPGALCEVRYEDLESHPIPTLETIYGKLGLDGFEELEARAGDYLRSIAGFKKNVLQPDPEAFEQVRVRWHRTFERYGYPV
ncbi:MAG: sulfotransferase [Thermodesulfobacteriota bacterium]